MTINYTVRPFDAQGTCTFDTHAMASAYRDAIVGQGRQAMLIKNAL